MMQIKEKGRRLYLIRTEYRPEKKRTYGKTIGKMDSEQEAIPNELISTLTNEECQQLKKYLVDNKNIKNVDRENITLTTIDISIQRAASALERGVPIHESQGQKIYKAVDRLKKAMRKAGHKKTRNEAPTVSQDLLGSVERPNISADDRQSKSTVPYPKIDYSNYIIE